MNSRRFGTGITVLCILAGAGGLACQGRGDHLLKEDFVGRAIQGGWRFTSTITSDGCNLGSSIGVAPIGGPSGLSFAQIATSVPATQQGCDFSGHASVLRG